MQTKNINIKVELDNDHIPSSIEWTADDLQEWTELVPGDALITLG